MPSDTRPTCKLLGENGNVFNIIWRVSSALRKAGMNTEADEFVKRAKEAESYDEVLRIVMEYVEVV